MERVSYLDGLRGIAAIVVVIGHMISCIFPSFWANQLVSETPFSLLSSGNLSVCIFFCLSGFVLSVGYINYQRNFSLFSIILKRYIRLVIPTAVSVFLAFILMKNSLMFNLDVSKITKSSTIFEGMYDFEPSWVGALRNGFFSAFIPDGGNHYNVVLWTMGFEFAGSCLIFLLLTVFNIAPKIPRGYFYIFFLILFFNSYFLCFLLGMIWAELYVNKVIQLNRIQSVVILISSLFLGMYPNGLPPLFFTPLKGFANNLPMTSLPFEIIVHMVSASCILLVVLNSNWLKKWLSSGICQFFGKISFSLYLIHIPIICSFSCILYLILINSFFFGSIIVSLITCIISFIVIIGASVLFTQIDHLAIRLSKQIQLGAEYFYNRQNILEFIKM